MTEMPPPPPPVQTAPSSPQSMPAKKGKGCAFYGCLFVFLLVLACAITAGVTVWWMGRPVKATELTPEEEVVLENKIEYMTKAGELRLESSTDPEKFADERLSEDDEDFTPKRIVFTERELNSLVNDWFAENTDFQNNILITLRPDTILGATTFDMPDFIPVIGGKSIRTKIKIYAGLENQKLDVRIQNISLGGVPLKDSWTGGLIGQNLVDDMASDDQMKALVDGIEEFAIRDGELAFKPAASAAPSEP